MNKGNEDIYEIEDPRNGIGINVATQNLITSKELAEYLQCCTKTVNNMARDGRIPYVTLGRRRRFDPAAVERALLTDPRFNGNK